MAIHAALNHRTEYRYQQKALLNPQTIRLRPAPHCRTRILSYSLNIRPAEHFINWQQDPYGNFLARIVFPERIPEFKVEVDLVAEMAVHNPFDFFLEDYAETFPSDYPAGLAHELEPFRVEPVDSGPRFREYLASIDRSNRHVVDFLVDLNRRVQEDIGYLIRMEPGVQTPESTLEQGSGSCRDSAWLLINLLRGLGLASRFASGYLIQLTPDQKALDGPSGPESDFSDLHAWAEVFLPGAGWIGFDPTSGLLAGEGHIPLACAPSPTSAAPISGTLEDVETDFAFHMGVQRIHETPRVTAPFAEESWKQLDALGQAVDASLMKADARLTMGGEPTFISIDDMEGEEWNTAAVGPRKLKLSQDLLWELKDKFAKGGVLHFGQGKWYPGESLPRWAFNCYWNPDGGALWRHPEYLADLEKDYGYGPEEAEQFLKTFAQTLGVQPDFVTPAFEDPWYFLWKEQQLPSNMEAIRNRLKDPEERLRLSRVFSRGLDEPRGWVLPIQRWWQSQAGPSWITGRWLLRRKNLFLIPGDSPVGLRLPLESLPHLPSSRYPHVGQQDPSFTATQSLPDLEQGFQHFLERARSLPRGQRDSAGFQFEVNPQELPEQEAAGEPSAEEKPVRTALCVEPRNGRLYVFMPPVRKLEDYLELLGAVESTAMALEMPVCIEGEKPPEDDRLHNFSITPDPGVIEVNIHPSGSWGELVEKTETLYETARQCRLGTEKFMVDGRHTGTGGGNHLVLGGRTPQESPFLRRPDLLRSMVAYWQQHPALSYLFSGLFIGPTSQSPRVDEGRGDALYELEIAFREIDHLDADPPPWMVDRIFRDLLTDLTGNTHRAEFCIDKLYSPDSSGGRRGLLELRSFEMPPHPRMSLAQQLLLRALVARFLHQPFKPRRLTRWGNLLHDKFMLPHYLWEDLRDILYDLGEFGLLFEEDWFQSHFEFRFPLYGKIQYKGITLEIRQALEPWNVLGEEGAAGGTVRFVDSSVERLQVAVEGMTSERYCLTCNQIAIPLQPTENANRRVGGIRYRAWQPPSCLHPTIPVDTPLVIDLYDTWNQRAVAGCTYHVGHPGGRNYDEFPINGFEAESRRLARFQPHGHTPGNWEPKDSPDALGDFPFTLDLRRHAHSDESRSE